MVQSVTIQEKRYASPIIGLIYSGFIALSFLCRGYFHLIELPWYGTQFSFAAIIILGIAWLFVTGNTRNLNTSINVMLVQMIPQIIILVWSVAIWVWNKESLSSIMRGSSLILYQLLLLSMLIFAGAMFGKKAIEYTAIGFILANTMILLDVMRRFGIVSTVTGIIQFILSAGSSDNTISFNLEIHDATFGIGILLVYYLVEGKEEHWRKFYIIALGFYFFTGFKRILVPAVAITVLYALLFKRMSAKHQVRTTVFIGISIIIVSLIYVILIRTDLWFAITDRLGINLMGRKRLYNRMKSYYSVSPIYMGIGFGRVSKVLEAIEVKGIRGLHSDILRLYIELGMPVFLLWCSVTFVVIYIYFVKKHSIGSARLYFAISLLMFFTFLTDNTVEYYYPQIAWHVLPLAMVLRDKEAFAESLFKKKEIPEPERRLQWVK